MKTVVKLYLVQPKALQECNIVYNPDDISPKFAHPSPESTYSYFTSSEKQYRKQVQIFTEIDVKATAILNGLCLKDESTHSKDRDLKLITPSDFTAIPAEASISEKFLPVSVIEVCTLLLEFFFFIKYIHSRYHSG